jgi:hypothetical protein
LLFKPSLCRQSLLQKSSLFSIFMLKDAFYMVLFLEFLYLKA